MKPVRIIIEYDNGSKNILEDDVAEWIELYKALVQVAESHGINMQDFRWKEE